MDRSLARNVIYGSLSLCYSFPDEEVYARIGEGRWLEQIKDSQAILTEKVFAHLLQSFVDLLAKKGEQTRIAMGQEYTRLFINASPAVIALPYCAVCLEKEGLASGKTIAEMLRCYHEEGFALAKDRTEDTDHIACAFAFMGVLADRENKATNRERIRLEEVQLQFLSRFILPWIESFCEKVMKQSRLPFYRLLGALTREYIHFEQNYLGIPEEMDLRKEYQI